MITWIRENAGIASILVGLIAIISGGAVAYHQLSMLIASQPAVENHIHDTARHIDPVRDAEIHKHLEEKVEKLEERIDEMEARQQRWRERSWAEHDRRPR